MCKIICAKASKDLFESIKRDVYYCVEDVDTGRLVASVLLKRIAELEKALADREHTIKCRDEYIGDLHKELSQRQDVIDTLTETCDSLNEYIDICGG